MVPPHVVSLSTSISPETIIPYRLGQRVDNPLQVCVDACLLTILGLVKVTMLSTIEAH